MLSFACVAGASAPEVPDRREGSEEGCTSQEHPKLPSRAAAGSRLSNPSPKEYAAFAGPQGIVDAAQMAQAASALQQSVQQSGLGPYFMQQAYAPQLARAQLQQVGFTLPCESLRIHHFGLRRGNTRRTHCGWHSIAAAHAEVCRVQPGLVESST